MDFPSCGFENPEGLKFCNECGASLQLRCFQCEFANQPQAKFCGECGISLSPRARRSPTPILAPRPHAPLSYTPTNLVEKMFQSNTALEVECKRLRRLFAGLKGSMELLADRELEESPRLLDPVLERMMDAVHRYEGTVHRVMGDGLMALFGATIPYEAYAVPAYHGTVQRE